MKFSERERLKRVLVDLIEHGTEDEFEVAAGIAMAKGLYCDYTHRREVKASLRRLWRAERGYVAKEGDGGEAAMI